MPSGRQVEGISEGREGGLERQVVGEGISEGRKGA